MVPQQKKTCLQCGAGLTESNTKYKETFKMRGTDRVYYTYAYRKCIQCVKKQHAQHEADRIAGKVPTARSAMNARHAVICELWANNPDMTQKEIAAELNVDRGTVQTALRRYFGNGKPVQVSFLLTENQHFMKMLTK